MNFQFEFEYNAKERNRIDRLNTPHSVGPGIFAVLWCLCFTPTILCLMWLQMWSVAVTCAVFVLLASMVPLWALLRGTTRDVLKRKIELTPVGKGETVGDSTTFIKWNLTDEVMESETDFLFCRNDRYSLLPKRVIGAEQIQPLRDNIALWRNQPMGATEPIEMYRELFQTVGSETWKFKLSRDDLVTATKSVSTRPIQDSTFNIQNVQFKKGLPRWFSFLIFALIMKAGLWLIVASIPPNQLDWLPIVIFLCFNPFVLLVAVGYWARRRGINSLPRLAAAELSLRLFESGWAIGNEDLAVFHKWNERSVFYVAKEFIGIRSDLSIIHILPNRGFNGIDGIWQFLNRAIRLKKNRLDQNSKEGTDTQKVNAVDNEDEPVNPYRSPSVKTG